jgi:hypothetical protein
MSDDLFKFDFLKVTHQLQFVSTEVLSKGTWDHVFFDGDFDTYSEEVRAVVQCRHCFRSWFNIAYRDFEKNNLSDLANNGMLAVEDISVYHIAEIRKTGDFTIYKTQNGGAAHYAFVFCKKCSTKHFIVLSVSEFQPGRYCGAVQGVWLVRE